MLGGYQQGRDRRAQRAENEERERRYAEAQERLAREDESRAVARSVLQSRLSKVYNAQSADLQAAGDESVATFGVNSIPGIMPSMGILGKKAADQRRSELANRTYEAKRLIDVLPDREAREVLSEFRNAERLKTITEGQARTRKRGAELLSHEMMAEYPEEQKLIKELLDNPELNDAQINQQFDKISQGVSRMWAQRESQERLSAEMKRIIDASSVRAEQPSSWAQREEASAYMIEHMLEYRKGDAIPEEILEGLDQILAPPVEQKSPEQAILEEPGVMDQFLEWLGSVKPNQGTAINQPGAAMDSLELPPESEQTGTEIPRLDNSHLEPAPKGMSLADIIARKQQG